MTLEQVYLTAIMMVCVFCIGVWIGVHLAWPN